MDTMGHPDPSASGPRQAVTDGAWWIIPSLLATLAAALALPMNVLFALLSMMPSDSCGPDGCGGGPTDSTAWLVGGTITDLALVVLCWVASRPARRVARMMLAFGAVAVAVTPPLIVFGSAGR